MAIAIAIETPLRDEGLERSAPGRFRKSVPRFSDQNLRQSKKPGRRSVGLPTKTCLDYPDSKWSVFYEKSLA